VLTLDRAGSQHPDGLAQAAFTWHVSDAVIDGRVVGIKGTTRLHADGGRWRLGETRLLDVHEKEGGAAMPALEQDARFHTPAGKERRRLAPTLH